jgi:hypothetical protein
MYPPSCCQRQYPLPHQRNHAVSCRYPFLRQVAKTYGYIGLLRNIPSCIVQDHEVGIIAEGTELARLDATGACVEFEGAWDAARSVAIRNDRISRLPGKAAQAA